VLAGKVPTVGRSEASSDTETCLWLAPGVSPRCQRLTRSARNARLAATPAPVLKSDDAGTYWRPANSGLVPRREQGSRNGAKTRVLRGQPRSASPRCTRAAEGRRVYVARAVASRLKQQCRIRCRNGDEAAVSRSDRGVPLRSRVLDRWVNLTDAVSQIGVAQEGVNKLF